MAAAANSTIEGNLRVRGTFSAERIELPDNAVGNDQFDQDKPLEAAKQQHQYLSTLDLGTVVASQTQTMHLAFGPGEVVEFRVSCRGLPTGTGTTSVDLQVNGTTILTNPVVLDTSNTVLVPEAANFISPTAKKYEDGDRIDIVVVQSATSGGNAPAAGVVVQLVLRELAD